MSSKTPADAKEQNNISIQKLFLDKIETYVTTPFNVCIPLYKFPSERLSEQEFLAYFHHLAAYLDTMIHYEQNKKVLSSRLITIKESLSYLRPDLPDGILQRQLLYAYF